MRLTETSVRQIIRRVLLESQDQRQFFDLDRFTPAVTKAVERLELPRDVDSDTLEAYVRDYQDEPAMRTLLSLLSVIRRFVFNELSPGLGAPMSEEAKIFLIELILRSQESPVGGNENEGDLLPGQAVGPPSDEELARRLLLTIATHAQVALLKDAEEKLRSNPGMTRDEAELIATHVFDKMARVSLAQNPFEAGHGHSDSSDDRRIRSTWVDAFLKANGF